MTMPDSISARQLRCCGTVESGLFHVVSVRMTKLSFLCSDGLVCPAELLCRKVVAPATFVDMPPNQTAASRQLLAFNCPDKGKNFSQVPTQFLNHHRQIISSSWPSPSHRHRHQENRQCKLTIITLVLSHNLYALRTTYHPSPSPPPSTFAHHQ